MENAALEYQQQLSLKRDHFRVQIRRKQNQHKIRAARVRTQESLSQIHYEDFLICMHSLPKSIPKISELVHSQMQLRPLLFRSPFEHFKKIVNCEMEINHWPLVCNIFRDLVLYPQTVLYSQQDLSSEEEEEAASHYHFEQTRFILDFANFLLLRTKVFMQIAPISKDKLRRCGLLIYQALAYLHLNCLTHEIATEGTHLLKSSFEDWDSEACSLNQLIVQLDILYRIVTLDTDMKTEEFELSSELLNRKYIKLMTMSQLFFNSIVVYRLLLDHILRECVPNRTNAAFVAKVIAILVQLSRYSSSFKRKLFHELQVEPYLLQILIKSNPDSGVGDYQLDIRINASKLLWNIICIKNTSLSLLMLDQLIGVIRTIGSDNLSLQFEVADTLCCYLLYGQDHNLTLKTFVDDYQGLSILRQYLVHPMVPPTVVQAILRLFVNYKSDLRVELDSCFHSILDDIYWKNHNSKISKYASYLLGIDHPD